MSKRDGQKSDLIPPEAADKLKRAILGLPHETGYRNPPKSHQFKKGQSGNPKGRPKRSKASPRLDRALLGAAERTVGVNRSDGREEISIREAVAEKATETALKGNAHAQRTILGEFRRAEEAELQRKEAEIARWTTYREDGWRAIARAGQEGDAEPLLIPHPDDVDINDDDVSFVGPTTPEDYVACQQAVQLRDAYLVQDALDRRMKAIPMIITSKEDAGYSQVMMMKIDKSLPPRLRLSEDDHLEHSSTCDRLTKRGLLKHVYRTWKALGIPYKRGSTYGTFIEHQAQDRLASIVAGALEEWMATEPRSATAIAEKLHDMLQEIAPEIGKLGRSRDDEAPSQLT